MEKETYTNEKGNKVERVVLAELGKDEKEFVKENANYFYFVDRKRGLVVGSPMQKKTLSKEEKVRRAKEKLKDKADKRKKLEEAEKELKDELEALQG